MILCSVLILPSTGPTLALTAFKKASCGGACHAINPLFFKWTGKAVVSFQHPQPSYPFNCLILGTYIIPAYSHSLGLLLFGQYHHLIDFSLNCHSFVYSTNQCCRHSFFHFRLDSLAAHPFRQCSFFLFHSRINSLVSTQPLSNLAIQSPA